MAILERVMQWNADRDNMKFDHFCETRLLAEELMEFCGYDRDTAKKLGMKFAEEHSSRRAKRIEKDIVIPTKKGTRTISADDMLDALGDILFVATGSIGKLEGDPEKVLTTICAHNEKKGKVKDKDGKILKPAMFIEPKHMDDKFYILIGHKCQQGKDTFGLMLQEELYGNGISSRIFHWADDVYAQCRNLNGLRLGFPLIRFQAQQYWCLDKLTDNSATYVSVARCEKLDKITKCKDYMAMEGKDSELLQWWGTDFRRTLFGENYWVELTTNNMKTAKEKVIIICDTRFRSEINAYTPSENAISIDMIRWDGKVRHISDTRDPRHASETDLDRHRFDYDIHADSGDLEGLKAQAEILVKYLMENTKWLKNQS